MKRENADSIFSLPCVWVCLKTADYHKLLQIKHRKMKYYLKVVYVNTIDLY